MHRLTLKFLVADFIVSALLTLAAFIYIAAGYIRDSIVAATWLSLILFALWLVRNEVKVSNVERLLGEMTKCDSFKYDFIRDALLCQPYDAALDGLELCVSFQDRRLYMIRRPSLVTATDDPRDFVCVKYEGGVVKKLEYDVELFEGPGTYLEASTGNTMRGELKVYSVELKGLSPSNVSQGLTKLMNASKANTAS
ncbi:MAG: hypothetical protein RXR09_05885 [Acidilobus sp.]|jgi:hypothetical protein